MSSPAAHTCSKSYGGFPCCHRQWRHPGHCRFVHGYSRSFSFWFAAHHLDVHGFVVDFSSLRPLRERLEEQFDHTFLVNHDDPLLEHWRELHALGALDLRVMANVGMEASAELVWGWANELLHQPRRRPQLLLAGGGPRKREQRRLLQRLPGLVPGGRLP